MPARRCQNDDEDPGPRADVDALARTPVQGLEYSTFGHPTGPVRTRHPEHELHRGQVNRRTRDGQIQNRCRTGSGSISERLWNEHADRLLPVAVVGWCHDRPNGPDGTPRRAAATPRPRTGSPVSAGTPANCTHRRGPVPGSTLVEFHQNWCPRPDRYRNPTRIDGRRRDHARPRADRPGGAGKHPPTVRIRPPRIVPGARRLPPPTHAPLTPDRTRPRLPTAS